MKSKKIISKTVEEKLKVNTKKIAKLNTDKKLHIVYLDFDDIKNPLLGAGQALSTFNVAKRLVALGHKVTVISSKYPGSKDRIQSGIRYNHIGIGTKNIRLNNAFYIFALPFAVRKIKADVIIECFTAPISTLGSPLFTNIPVIGKSASFDAEQFTKLYHLPFHYIEAIGAQFYSYFLSSSEYYLKKMKFLNPKVNSKLITEGVNPEYFSIKHESGKYILFLGRLDINQKGIDLLLQAFAKVKEKINIPLYIAGHGPDEAKVKEMIEKYELKKYVKLVGSAYGEKKFKLMKNAALIALPSRHEGFSLFTLEAFAAGLPVIMFDIPGLAWVKPSVMHKIAPFDIDEFSKNLVQYSKKSQSFNFSAKLRNYAKKYTWEIVTQKYLHLIAVVIAEHQN